MASSEPTYHFIGIMNFRSTPWSWPTALYAFIRFNGVLYSWCVPITSPRTNAELATTALRTKKYLRALAIMSATSTSRNLRRPSHYAKTIFHPLPSPSSYPPSYTSHLALSIREHTQVWNRLSLNHYYQRCQRTRNRE